MNFNIKYIFALICILYVNITFPQDNDNYSRLYFEKSYSINLNSQLPLFNFLFQSFVDSSMDVFSELRYKIIITENKSADTLQIIENLLGSPLGFQSGYPGLTFYDINFDGYKDIQMFQWTPGDHGYPPYYNIYLYEKRNKIFVLNTDYTEKVGCNFEIDVINKIITASLYSSENDGGYSIVNYKVENGRLILINDDNLLNK